MQFSACECRSPKRSEGAGSLESELHSQLLASHCVRAFAKMMMS